MREREIYGTAVEMVEGTLAEAAVEGFDPWEYFRWPWCSTVAF
jgi:hypothetical protein